MQAPGHVSPKSKSRENDNLSPTCFCIVRTVPYCGRIPLETFLWLWAIYKLVSLDEEEEPNKKGDVLII